MDDGFLNPEIDALIRTGEAYLEMSFGFRLNLSPIDNDAIVDDVRVKFQAFRGFLHNRSVIVLHHNGKESHLVDDYLKYTELASSKLESYIVLVMIDSMSALLRRQMMDQKVGFLVPGSQLYIPEMFLHLKDRAARAGAEPMERISPLAQLVIIGVLLGERLEGANLTELAERFHVSVMSMSRTMDELEALGVARAKFGGRERFLHLPVRGRLLWDEMKGRLRSPVRKTRSVKGDLPHEVARLSGKAALAYYAQSDTPGVQCYAVFELVFNRIEKNAVVEFADPLDRNRIEVEAWTYDPCIFSKNGIVDPLSLYLIHRYDNDADMVALEKLADKIAG